MPVLGVCLGHQALAARRSAARVVRGEPVHGKTAEVEHDGRTIFAGLESPLVVGRYHSLVVDPDLPDELEVLRPLAATWSWASATASSPPRACSSTPSRCSPTHGKQLLRNFLADA